MSAFPAIRCAQLHETLEEIEIELYKYDDINDALIHEKLDRLCLAINTIHAELMELKEQRAGSADDLINNI